MPRTDAERDAGALADMHGIQHQHRNGSWWYCSAVPEAEAHAQGRAEAEAELKARGWLDEYEAATNSAMDHGNGYAQGRAEALAAVRPAVEACRPFDRAALLDALDNLEVDTGHRAASIV